MQQDNWLDRLAALRDTMPGEVQDDTQPDVPENNTSDSPAETARLDIILERKGRAGKSATIVSGFTIGDDGVAMLASELKRRLGTGGSARGGEILIQGDRRTDVLAFFKSKGIKARII